MRICFPPECGRLLDCPRPPYYGHTVENHLYQFSHVRVRDLFTIPDLAVRAGVVTVLRGPSGCGKTSALRLLNRMTPADGGSILYRGQSLESLDPVVLRREVVMLAQNAVLFTDKVRDDLLAGCRFAEQPDPDEKTLKGALETVRLPKSLEEDPGTFSGGEKQRLALARVLLMEPPVLLLDEPSAGLDRETEEAVFSVIRRLREEGRSVIVATHARDLEQLGDLEVLLFREARLERQARLDRAEPERLPGATP
ncbi:MAG: ABC transporter ATP-binding protein [Spirochaetaceae bacterium]|nr:MAG: ABC transporter ATP-binding protein [Spirochaetaceae bacterium]